MKDNIKRLYAKIICRIISSMVNAEMILFNKMCQKLNLNDENKENFLFDAAFNGADFDEFWENKMS